MKIIIVASCSSKRSIVDVWQVSGYVSSSEYPRFWIDQVSEYASGFVCAIVLDLLQSSEYSRVTHVAEYAWMIPEFAWICLIMSEYVWRSSNMPEYAWICLNLPKLLFFYIFLFFNFFYKPYYTWARVYLFDRLQETRGYSLKQHEAVFLKGQNFIFSIVAGSISFVSCFRLNVFTSKIQILCYLSGARGWVP